MKAPLVIEKGDYVLVQRKGKPDWRAVIVKPKAEVSPEGRVWTYVRNPGSKTVLGVWQDEIQHIIRKANG